MTNINEKLIKIFVKKYYPPDGTISVIDNSGEYILDWLRLAFQKVREDERDKIKQAFIKEFAGSGELWFPYVNEDTTKEDELEVAENSWNDIITSLSIKHE